MAMIPGSAAQSVIAQVFSRIIIVHIVTSELHITGIA